MGVIGEAVETIAGKAGKEELGVLARKTLTSSEGMLKDTEAGKYVYGLVEKFLGDTKSDAAKLYEADKSLMPNMTPQQHKLSMQNSYKQAFRMNDTIHFGLNRNKITQAIGIARQQKNAIHATEIGDYVSYALREEQPKTFRTLSGKSTDWRSAAGLGASPYKAPKDAERQINDILAYSYLGRVALPHTMQQFNSALTLGWKAWAKAWVDPTMRESAHVTAETFDETLRNWRLIAEGKDTWFTKIFHMPGFSQLRMKYIQHAADAGRFAAIDAAERYVQTGSKGAEQTLKFLRLDPAKIRLQGGKLLEEDIERAGYASADENMFIQPGKTPQIWGQSGLSRSLAMYKNFQFREGKLIKDTIARSLRSGPKQAAATLMTIGVAFPIAGHIIADMENLATGRSPEDRSMILRPTGIGPTEGIGRIFNLDERIDDLAHMASFGMSYSMFRATARHRALDYLAGPALGLLANIGYGLYQTGKGNPNYLVKEVARRTPVVGPAIAAYIDDIEDFGRNLIP